jgi:hypothetical protein
MIIQRGNSDAVSFNDDSSPDGRTTSGQKISVNAQVIAEYSTDWYYRILRYCASVTGELKSTQAWPVFQGLSWEERKRIWIGLSKVRIHVVDPRPYRKQWNEVVSAAWRCDDATEIIGQFVLQGVPGARQFLNQLEIYTAESVLSDSFAVRLHRASRYLRDELMLFGIGDDTDEENPICIRDFGQDAKPMVRKVSNWAAKSAATFHESMDCLLDPGQGSSDSPFFSTNLVRRRMESRVLQTHAFDKGDCQQISLLENARKEILQTLRGFDSLMNIREIKPYSQVDSSQSYFIQAADIAAGIATRILETENLEGLVTRFSYVTYNGRRMSMADAEEEVRRLRSRRICS